MRTHPVVNGKSYQYGYDSANRLTSVNDGSGNVIANYAYDAEGNRISKTTGGVTTYYHYFMGNLQYETLSTDPSNVIHALYLRTPQGALEAVSLNYTVGSSSNTFYYYHYNAHGDIIAVTDANGNLYRQYIYDPYGNVISEKDGSGNNININSDTGFNNAYTYAGYRYDSESSLYFLNSRYYAPSIGRFLTKDSQINDIETHSLNLYAYVNGDPVNFYDKDGARPDFSDGSGQETSGDTAASLACMSKVNMNRYVQAQNHTVSKVIHNISNLTGSAGGSATLAAGDCYVASKVAESWNSWLFKPASFTRSLDCDLGGLYAASKITKVCGALAVAGFAIGVWDNFANYKHSWARTIVDIGVFGGCAVIGLGLATIGAPVVLGAALSIGGSALLTAGGDAVKNTWLNDPKS